MLQAVQSGQLSVDKALDSLRSFPYEDIGFAKIDTHRALRRGFPEVIFCQGKTIHQIQQIVKKMLAGNSIILAMRASMDVAEGLREMSVQLEYNEMARAVIIGQKPKPVNKGIVLVISAGTADLPVSEEAAVTAEAMANRVKRLTDVGVAGVHRLLDNIQTIQSANVIVVAAGMEGALPGVVAGLVDKPVIGIPTNVGYGTHFGGISPLLTMLNSCSPGLAVVNIDNGFGAGYMAALINRLGKGSS